MTPPSDSQPEPGAVIVVVNYGSHELLERNLAPLTRAVPLLRTVVVDNFTSPNERAQVLRLARENGWTSLLLDSNVGFGAGVNLGVGTVDEFDSLVLLNPDATLQPAGLLQLLEHVRQHPLEVVAPRVETPDGRIWSMGSDLLLETGEMRGWHKRPPSPDPAAHQPWLSGACLALSRSMWERAGGFDNDYFLYWEDVDLARRLTCAGGTLTLLAEVVATHDQGATHRGAEDRRAKSATYYYWNARNRLVFAAKNLSPQAQKRWVRASPGAGYRLLLQGGRRQLIRPRRNLLPVIRGTRDGWLAMQTLRNNAKDVSH